MFSYVGVLREVGGSCRFELEVSLHAQWKDFCLLLLLDVQSRFQAANDLA